MTGCSCVEDVVCGACMTGGAASIPTADDVREVTRSDIADEISGIHVGRGYESTTIGINAALEAADAIREVFEVRPRGAVTAEAREAEMRELHHFEVEQQLAETIAIVKRAQAAVLRHEHTPASLHMDDILNEVNTEIPSASEVRPRGPVTDAEVEAAVEAFWKCDDPTGGPISMRAALEAARLS